MNENQYPKDLSKKTVCQTIKQVLFDLKYTLIHILAFVGAFYIVMMIPDTCHASLESSLTNMKSKLTGFILPVMAVIGMAGAALSSFVGHENAKKHAIYAAVGCVIGFGAQAIVDFISQTVV